MSINYRRKFLDAVLEDLAACKAPTNIDAVIAGWLERDLATLDGTGMAETHAILVDHVRAAYRLLPQEMAVALRDSTDPVLVVANHVAMVGMAQLLVGTALQRRAGASALACLNDPDNLDAMIAVNGEDRSVEEIATACGTDSIEQAVRMTRIEAEGLVYRRRRNIEEVWSLNPSIGPAVEQLALERRRSRAVEKVLAVLEDVPGEDAGRAARELRSAFEGTMTPAEPGPSGPSAR